MVLYMVKIINIKEKTTPVLHFKSSGQDRALTFVDTIEKYGHILKDEDLGAAYKRYGKSFRGQLGQHFVVLRDQPLAQQVLQQPRQEKGQGRGGQLES